MDYIPDLFRKGEQATLKRISEEDTCRQELIDALEDEQEFNKPTE